MTADSFYIVLASFCCWIFRNTNESERDVTPPTIHTVVSNVKLHWNLGIFNFIVILRLRLQIEYVVIVISGNCKFENGQLLQSTFHSVELKLGWLDYQHVDSCLQKTNLLRKVPTPPLMLELQCKHKQGLPVTDADMQLRNESGGRAWLAQLVRSLPSNQKVPGSIPTLPRFESLCDFFFLPKPTQLSILPG